MQAFFREKEIRNFRKYEEWFQSGEIPEGDKWNLEISENGISSWHNLVYYRGESLDNYLERNGISEAYKHPISTYAFVDDEGWESQGEMGWFGFSSNDKDKMTWNKMVEAFIEALPDGMFLVSVDCHI